MPYRCGKMKQTALVWLVQRIVMIGFKHVEELKLKE